MASRENVQRFLQDFQAKLGIWGVIFRDDRGKNSDALLRLEIETPVREKILTELQVTDYSDGPKSERLNGGPDMWVFGKIVNGHEVYIKISMGTPGRAVFCISFHIAEHPMNYPLK